MGRVNTVVIDGSLGGGGYVLSGAWDRNYRRAVGGNLGDFGGRRRLGHEDAGGDTGAGGVRSGGGSCVAGRVLDDLLYASGGQGSEEQSSAPVLERAGGRKLLHLGLESGQAIGRAPPGEIDDRSGAFSQGDRGDVGSYRQEPAITPDAMGRVIQ